MREKATLKKDQKKDLLRSRLIYFVFLRNCRQIPHSLSFDFPDFPGQGRAKYAVISDASIAVIPSFP